MKIDNSHKAIIAGIALFVTFLTYVIYLPTLRNGFVWDDILYVYENHNIRSINIKLLYWDPTVVLWHPLTMLSLALDYAVWGLNPSGYHNTNNLIHTVNTFLVFVLTVQLMRKTAVLNNEQGDKTAIVTGFITALLFGIHPLQVESVAWIAERKEVLCASFFLLTLLAYIKYTTHTTKKKKLCHYALCIIFFTLALLSKPMAVSLPIVFLIIDFYPLGRIAMKGLKNSKGVLLEKLPFFILSLALSLITVWTDKPAGMLPTSIATLPLPERIVSALYAYVFYLMKMLLPFNLSPFYPFPGKISFFYFRYIGSFLLLSAIIFFAVYAVRENKVFLAISLYYLFTLFPTMGIFQIREFFAADRYSYLPSIGYFLLVGIGIMSIMAKCFANSYKVALFAVLIFISGTLIVKTLKQISIWHDSVTLWSHVIELYPASTAYYNRGLAFDEMGVYQKALRDYGKAIELNPKMANAHYNRGFIFGRMGNDQQAIAEYSNAIEITANQMDVDVEAFNNRGAAYARLGNYQSAIIDFNEAIKIKPEDSLAYYNLGLAYLQSGNQAQALINFKKAARLGYKQAQDYLVKQDIVW